MKRETVTSDQQKEADLDLYQREVKKTSNEYGSLVLQHNRQASHTKEIRMITKNV